MADEDKMMDIYKKIEREKALIQAANLMRQQTNNDNVRSKLDTQMREGKRNLEFFEEKLKELQLRRGMSSMSIASDGSASGSRSRGQQPDDDAPPAPPKDASGFATSGGEPQYSQIGQHGDLMPPRHPYAAPGPGSHPKTRPNYTKLGMLSRGVALLCSAPFAGPLRLGC
jgi:classical protein kinase C